MSKPTVLALIDVHGPTTAKLESAYDLSKLWSATDPKALLNEIAPSVRGVVTSGIAGMDKTIMSRLPALEIVGVFGVGVDKIDLETARALDVHVTNTPDVLTDGVAELALALLLDVARKVTANDRYVRRGRWSKEGDPPLASTLQGRTLGILGMGRIGQAIATLASAFGMTIIYGGPRRKPDLAYEHIADPVALAEASDALMVSCKGGPETARLVDAAVIDALGPDGWLVNVARGSVIDEEALAAALSNGRLGAAGLDVFAEEPKVPTALFELDNVVLQPHQGSATEETRTAMGDLMLDNIAAHFAGRPLLTPVV